MWLSAAFIQYIDIIGRRERLIRGMTNKSAKEPVGELALRTLAMPADTNVSGDIFGGWLLSQMDIAGGMAAKERAKGRVVTVAVDRMIFHRPVYVGDAVCCYCQIQKVGRTSLTRHSPDDIQIRGRRTTDPPPWELRTLRSPPMRRLWRADQVRNAIWQSIPPSRRTSPIVFTSPLISSAYAGTGLGRRSSIKLKIFWNKLLGTATSANWNVTYRP